MNDLYVRFFRMAERRIAEKTGRGVVCFISNYSWLDGLSFTGMRERYLEAFDAIRIDCLNGDKYKTGKTTPDGRPDPSVFSTPGDPVGIQVGTAITTLVRKAEHASAETVGFRHLWGQAKLTGLTDTAEAEPAALYGHVEPVLPLGLPFAEVVVSRSWSEWPSLPDLFPTSFPGVKTGSDSFLVDIDLDKLKLRIRDHFDSAKTEHIRPDEQGFIRYAYRPFDSRWLYWETDSGLLDRPRPDYKPHVFAGNFALVSQQKPRREWSSPQVIHDIGCLDLMDRSATCIPTWLRDEGLPLDGGEEQRRPNLSTEAQRYLDRLGMGVEDLFHHTLAVLHDPTYRETNAGALRMEWPRILLPGWPDGDTPGVADELRASAARGRELAALLDPETPVVGVTTGMLRPVLAVIAVPSTSDGRNMTGDDFALTAGWGHFGTGDAVMPGQGRAVERDYTAAEREALGDAVGLLGAATVDVHLNDNTRWSNVPSSVWNYKLGGYQVLKKWLSYREGKVLGRNLLPEEVQHFTDTARRIGAILGPGW